VAEAEPGGEIYWSVFASGLNSKIQRADLDGNNVEVLMIGRSGTGHLGNVG